MRTRGHNGQAAFPRSDGISDGTNRRGGVQFGHLLGGAVIVETVFGWPGLGKELITAIGYRDYAVVQACIFVMTFLVVAINFAVDFSYRLIDPRLRRA